MVTTTASIAGEFHREIVETGRLAAFVFFVVLLGTFGFIRTSTYLIRKQVSWWPGNVSVGGTHVHHLVWGICAMIVFGYIGAVHQPESPWREILAGLFAVGVGLTLDEFALWLELKDVYWEKDGRKSIDAMIIAGCLAAIALVGLSEVQTGDKRDLAAVVRALSRMPLATMPWWRSLQVMNENKGVFGLNMLKWWDQEGLDRVLEPLAAGLASGEYKPVVAEAFEFGRAGEAHRFIAERRNVGKVVLVP